MTTVAEVRQLIRNLEPTDDATITAAIRVARDHIRGRLARLYPNLPDNAPDYPPPLPTIATFLAAALVQANTLSLTQVGGTQNPFALQLYQTAKELLDSVARGHIVLVGYDAKMLPAFRTTEPDQPSPVGLRRIRQHRNTGSR